MRKALCVSLCVAIFVAGCAGTDPNPVSRTKPGDEALSCAMLRAEVGEMDNLIVTEQKQKDETFTWNIAMFVAGWFLIVPWFFMNLKGAEEVEIEAAKARKHWLRSLALDKGCTFSGMEWTR